MKQQTVSIKEIMTRVGIGDDTIRKYGHSVSASIPIEKAIEILRPRTVAGGRWPIDKANRAAQMLAELQALQLGAAKVYTTANTLPAETPAEQGSASETPKKRLNRFREITELDIVFGVNVVFAVYGFLYNFKEMGIPASCAFCGVSIHAMKMCKNRESQVTAQAGIAAVWVLEAVAFFIHLSMINLRLWETGYQSKLPFSVWENTEAPFMIAAILAGLLSLASVYSVSVSFAKMREKIAAEEFERAHGIKY